MRSDTVKIVSAKTGDAAGILALQKLAFQSDAEIHDDYSVSPLTQTLEDLLEEFKIYRFYKALKGKDLVGSVRTLVKGDTCHIGRLIVHPQFQNQGIGSSLMSCVELRHPEVERFELFTGHRSMRNLILCRKLGYMEFKREIIHGDLTLVFLEKRNKAT